MSSAAPVSASGSPAAIPPTLNRVCCLRCAKRLEHEDDVPCVFSNARSSKCERCSRLKSKCTPVSPPLLGNPPETPLIPLRIPSASVPAAQALLALQAAYRVGPTPGRRSAVSSAAADLTAEAEVKARTEPKTLLAASLALLREQKETNRLLRLLLVSPPFLLSPPPSRPVLANTP